MGIISEETKKQIGGGQLGTITETGEFWYPGKTEKGPGLVSGAEPGNIPATPPSGAVPIETVLPPPSAIDEGTTNVQPMDMDTIGGETSIVLGADIADTGITKIGGVALKTIEDNNFLQGQVDKLNEEIKALTEKQTDLTKPTQPVIPSMTEEIKKLQEKYKIPEQYEKILALTPEIDFLNNQLVNMYSSQDRALLGVEQRLQGYSGSIVRGEQLLVKKNYAIDIAATSAQLGAKTALAEMYRGNVGLARSIMSDTVQAITWDTNQKITEYNWMYSEYRDEYNALESKVKTNIDKSYNLLLVQYDEQKKEKTQVGEMMFDNPESGISIEDSLEEATIKATEWKKEHPELSTQIVGSATTGYSAVSIDSQGNVVKSTSINVAGAGISNNYPVIITDDGKQIPVDLTTVSGIGQYKGAGGLRAEANAWLDSNTDFDASTRDDMLDVVYGLEKPSTVSGQKLWVEQKLMDYSTREGVTKEEARAFITSNGFLPDDDDFKDYLDMFEWGRTWWERGRIRGALGFGEHYQSEAEFIEELEKARKGVEDYQK